ncbi:MAG: ATP-binding protein [Gammaproteobacteria bacterium]|nr:ATP-binding protein [Gammaproteobacteria bacterium]MDH5629322.1 ATP-binding protein [Gammaproteobacteria bacterium]
MQQVFNMTLPFSSSWKALQIFSVYRLLLALSLLFLFNSNLSTAFLGVSDPHFFYVVANIYLIVSIFTLITSFVLKSLYFVQVYSQVLLDIIFITLIMHTSGGNSSGIGVLIAISTSATCILTGRPTALIFSVLASAAIFGEEYYSKLHLSDIDGHYTRVGILSVMFMASSLMSYYLSRRIIESEHVAEASIKGMENMQQLNEEIIRFMATGILAVDNSNYIRQINRAALIYLGHTDSVKSQRLDQVSSALSRQLNLWRMNTYYQAKVFKNTATGPNLIPSFHPIGNSKNNTIIFLEDTTTLTQRAQSLKLASLGRLTASIAHEIRNPLGALSHAAQLMKESDTEDSGNHDLIEIINKNTTRVNNIIENILKLSQRKSVQIQEIDLVSYLPTMVKEYLDGKDEPPDIEIFIPNEPVMVNFDPSQLSQILINLIDNAIFHSKKRTDEAYVQISIGYEPHSNNLFLDVIDKGEGVDEENIEKIFEPFFTTSRSGTGLGLYLSKELCEVNRARLDYIPIATKGSCFRITFASTQVTLKTGYQKS